MFICRVDGRFFYQCLTNINIAVQQLDGVGREVKLWSHVGVVIT